MKKGLNGVLLNKESNEEHGARVIVQGHRLRR